jgi:hypothetical protein
MSEQERIETVLGAIDRPPFVTEIRHALDTDAAGEPAIWVWVVLEDDTADSAEFFERSEVVKSKIVQSLREAQIDRWPYVRFRGQSEQADLDRAEAA